MKIERKLKKKLNLVRENKKAMRRFLIDQEGYDYEGARTILKAYKKSRKQ